MNKTSLLLSLAAGLLGGLLAQYVAPSSVHAQTPRPAPSEIRAQNFVLLNENGDVSGSFGFDNQGHPIIRLFEKGREVWSAGGSPTRQLAQK